jgi:hypothetical protein
MFSVLVTVSGGWTLPFLLAGGQLFVMAVCQTVILARRGRVAAI